MVEVVKITRKVFASLPMSNFTVEEFLPGNHVKTDQQIEDFVRAYTETLVCSCKSCNNSKSIIPLEQPKWVSNPIRWQLLIHR